MAFRFNIYSIPHFVAIGMILFLYYVLIKRRTVMGKPLDRETVIFSFLLAGILLWDVGEVLLNASTNYATADLWARVSNVGLSFVPPILLHFVMGYPVDHLGDRKRRLAIVSMLYISGVFWSVLIGFTNSVFVVVHTGANGNVQWQYTPMGLFLIFILYILTYMVMALYMMYRSFRGVDNLDIKRQAKFMLVGMAVVLFFLFMGDMIARSLGGPPNLMDSFSGLILAMFFSISAFKYNLMDLQIILEKTIAYTSVTAVLAVIFISVEEVFEGIFSNAIGMGGGSIVPNIISALIVSFMLDPIKTRIESMAERIFPVKSFEE